MTALPPYITALVLTATTLLTAAHWVRLVETSFREVEVYKSYCDVTVLPFNIPDQTLLVYFNFTAIETITSGNGRCPPRHVSVAIKPGSLPVLNPDGSSFPDHFLPFRLRLHEAKILSDGHHFAVKVRRPVSGDWFAVVFLPSVHPNDDPVVQRELLAVCRTMVSVVADALVQGDVTELAPRQRLRHQKQPNRARRHYKCFVPLATQRTVVNVTVNVCKGDCPTLDIAVDARRLPDVKKDKVINPMQVHCSSEQITKDRVCLLAFTPSEGAWHYFTISSVPSGTSSRNEHYSISYAIEVTFNSDDEEWFWKRLNLLRQLFTEDFAFNYLFPHDIPEQFKTAYNSGETLGYLYPINSENEVLHTYSVNITTTNITFMSFELLSLRDIGGTMSFFLHLDVDQTNVATKIFQISVVSCMSYSSRSLPQFPDKCISSSGVESVASVRVNSTTPFSFTGRVHLPFPESGQWYVSLRPFCLVRSSNEGSEYENVNCEGVNETAVSFIIYSQACGPDKCGPYGYCSACSSGSIYFASCLCKYGFIGWGCTDDRYMTKLLIATLLLTLSNLFFLPAVVICARRRQWTLTFVYVSAALCSTLYHACDTGGSTYSFCLLRPSVLQLFDFFTATVALWVTLLAMAALSVAARSLALVAGIMAITLGMVLDHTSLAMYVVPTLGGAVLVCVLWVRRCRRRKACYPSVDYWKYFFPPAVLLIGTGFCCFSFLQTEANYKYVHSAWHGLIALSIVFLLPRNKHVARAADHEEGTGVPDDETNDSDGAQNDHHGF